MRPRRLGRILLNNAASLLSFDTAILISKQLLSAQGFGSGGNIENSGELAVFGLVRAPQPVLFDVGGHLGVYTREFLKALPSGRSFVFEPSASHLAQLRKNLGDNPAIKVFPFGLGDEAANLPLYKEQDISGLATLTQRRLDYMNIKLEAVETVAIRTLDSVVEETGVKVIDLLKMDVEGHELAVLRGAVKAMENGVIRMAQFEFGGCNLDTRTTLQDFFYFFKTYNFAIGLVRPSGRVHLLDRYDEFFEQYRTANFLAVPRAALAARV